MNIRIIRADECVTTRWSGGTTTQVYIFPEDGSYAERKFLFRLSMANAEVEDSVYTELPGVTRYLVSLCGECDVVHEGRAVHLSPFGTVDCFAGDIHTEAHGAIRDFNLMLKGEASGAMSVLHESSIELTYDYTHYALYAWDDAQISIDGADYALEKGDCLLITDCHPQKAYIPEGTGKIILCRIKA